MSADDIHRRKAELQARRARLSATQQAQLDQRLGSEQEAAPAAQPAALIPLHTGSTLRRPLFLIHPVNGEVACYLDLVRRLDPAQPCYGLQAARALAAPAAISLEGLAAGYSKLIRDRQPTGPYLLGGWSFGGVVAFEIARQIQAQAQPIGGLYLLDSQLAAPEPALSPGAADETAELIGFALALGLPLKFETAADLTLEEQYTQAVAYLRTLNPDQQLAYVVQQAQRARVVSYEFDVARARQALGMFKAHMQALKNYHPGLYSGPLILFTASERFSAQLIDGSSAWAALTRAAVRVCDVPGNHYTLLQEPQVAQLAAQLNTQLLTAAQLR